VTGIIMETLVTRTLELTVDGRDRKCPVYVPGALNAAQPVPLLLVFHGAEGTGASMIKKFRALADRNGFLIAAPDGIGGRWNALQPDEIAATGNADEPAFAAAILNALEKEYSVDSSRIYASGFSNGGALCQVLASRPESRLAAIACVGATLPAVLQNQIVSAPSVSVLLLTGSDDEFFGAGGSKLGPFLSVNETARLWAEHNKCSLEHFTIQMPQPTPASGHPSEGGELLKSPPSEGCRNGGVGFPAFHTTALQPLNSLTAPARWINEKTGVEVQSRWIEGGKHSWRLSADLDTSLTIWQFLSAHSRYTQNS